MCHNSQCIDLFVNQRTINPSSSLGINKQSRVVASIHNLIQPTNQLCLRINPVSNQTHPRIQLNIDN